MRFWICTLALFCGLSHALGQEPTAKDNSLEAYRNREYKTALNFLENEDESDAETHFMRALIYIKQSNFLAARREMNAIDNQSLTKENLETYNDIQAQLESESGEINPYWLTLEAGGGYTNNIYSSAPSSTLTSSTYSSTDIGTGYHFLSTYPTSFILSYAGTWEEYQNASDARTVIHRVQIPILHEEKYFTVSLSPYVEHDSWGGDPALGLGGARLKVTYAFKDLEIGTINEYTRQSALDSTYSYLTGHLTRHRIFAGFITYPFHNQIYAEYGTDQVSDTTSGTAFVPLANRAYTGGIKIAVRPFQYWDLTANYEFTSRDYASVPRNVKKRMDQMHYASIKLNYLVFESFSIFAKHSYTNNISNYGRAEGADKSYELHYSMLGVSWDIL